ncbi:hypothetical protein [Qipengyuania seohaensis]|uniref:hypothetical protein n=1 Tax=Qipengyuania seohaensis TaxID=266951 RepID=UPI0012FDCD4C|nr:hypothetical protein [Qipengyuania seohaensis]
MDDKKRRERAFQFKLSMAIGVTFAIFPFLIIVMGDCWASYDTSELIRECEQEKRFEGRFYLVAVAAIWIAAIVRRARNTSISKLLAIGAGPLAFASVLMMSHL